MSSAFSAANALIAAYRCLIDRRQALLASGPPPTLSDTAVLLRDVTEEYLHVVLAALELDAAMQKHGVESLPEEVRPESEYVVERLRSLHDVGALRAALEERILTMEQLAGRSDSEIESDPRFGASLAEPYSSQWQVLQDAVTSLNNQVQHHKAKSTALAWQRAATLQGLEYTSSHSRGDDGSETHVTTFTFESKDQAVKQSWWRKIFSRR